MPTLNFKGKTFVQNHHLAVKFQQLVPRVDLSVTDRHSLHDNLIVQGDNLAALKALLPTYAGRVKCVYIDPPYNTGNESWAYNDNVNAPMIQSWLGKVVDKEDLTRHDKWLCLMMPRLKLLRELMREDGVIFVSIDDNEQHHLRLLMDEIFGADNFVTNIIWEKKYSPQNDAKYFSDMHDFVICYAKKIDGWDRNLIQRTEKQDKAYQNTDNDARGIWKASDLTRSEYRERDFYGITTPSGKIVHPAKGRSWSRPPEEIERLRNDDRLWFGKNGDAIPSLKRFLTEVKEGTVPVTLWGRKDVGDNQEGKKQLIEIFPETNEPFATPKPTNLIKRIIEIATNAGDIILDSFAGSATTAQSVLELNKEDGGNRKFILVEMEDYANTITAERVRRVIKGVPTAKNAAVKKGLGGTFSYFELGEELKMEWLLRGDEGLPSYEEFARYLFFTATGEQLDVSKIRENELYLGESRHYHVWLQYKPDIEWLKRNGLTLEDIKHFPPATDAKKRLFFAPLKYVDDETLREARLEFLQLPYEVYRTHAK